MALSITVTNLIPKSGGYKGGRKSKLVKFVGDASMPAAGYTVAAASVGLRIVELGVCGKDQSGAYDWAIIPSASSTSALTASSNQFTLRPFDSAGATVSGASVAAISDSIVYAVVYGF